MTTHQQGLFSQGSSQFYYLEYNLDWSLPLDTIRSALHAAVYQNLPTNMVVSFGKRAWDALNPGCSPAGLVAFEGLQGSAEAGAAHLVAPATQADVFFWIHSGSVASNIDRMQGVHEAMAGVADLVLDLPGLCYHDSRDLSGFEDGSANPKTDDARIQAALIPAGQPGAGGSYVLSQKWVHNLKAFNQMPVKEQEGVIGRTKLDAIELEGDDMPANSHVSRTDVSLEGVAQKVWRRSGAYASATERGLYFLSFACELRRHSIQLERMYGLTGDGLYDRLLDFSTPVTGSYWFAPSMEDLAAALAV
ncbi:Dyp-type peroxidase [Oceanobacter kriegii]|uniref:Dyp-type peroxidase n=1 Tax=Oceanobacter kriegii TaxID=64972 RepID=UPI0003F516B2|nr:Dyp-type peroxidase [Oceanobacter kriegii]